MKKYDAPCAVCGKILHGGPKSLPAGVRTCHDCRRIRREGAPPAWTDDLRDCSVCGTPYVATCAKAKYCSKTCKRSHAPTGAPSRTLEAMRANAVRAVETERACVTCGTTFVSKGCRRRCTECQLAGLTRRKTCRNCGVYIPAHRRYCSGQACQSRQVPCVECSAVFEALTSSSLLNRRCAACSRRKTLAHWRRKNAVRRGAAPVGKRMSIQELGERDGWICHLCRTKVDPTFRAPDRRSPTFDHLIPVSAHGDDSPENLALAHWSCNSRRGARGVVQLLLVG